MKKRICVLTSTRADYGLLKPIIAKLNNVEKFDVRIVATGAHLSPEFGLTYQEIERDNFVVDKKIDMLLSADSPSSISKSMGLAMIGFADYFEELNPDLLIILGDRYETLAVATAALNQRIPIAHLYGGETTEGAIDESIRHAITKLSYLHFTSTDEYRDRVIQLGEHPERVHNVGAIGIENIMHERMLSREDIALEMGISLSKPYALVTYHPVTLEKNSAEKQTKALLETCKEHSILNFVFTKANADVEGRVINQLIDEYASSCNNIVSFTSLGSFKYLSALKYALMVIGNSSSGLVEAPSFGIPTINIGDRQKGRLQASSVINCNATQESIRKALALASSKEFLEKASKTANPYGDGNTSDKIIAVVKDCILCDKIDIKKKFYNCEAR